MKGTLMPEPTRDELLLALVRMGQLIQVVLDLESATPHSREALLWTMAQLGHIIMTIAGVAPPTPTTGRDDAAAHLD
jgi:hypothetical protein